MDELMEVSISGRALTLGKEENQSADLTPGAIHRILNISPSALLDTDAEVLLAAAVEEEQGMGAAGDAAVAFNPVNGTGLVFFMDAAGGLRGVLAWGLVPPPSASAAAGDR